MATATRTRTRTDADLNAAANDEMTNPDSPVLAELAQQLAAPDGSISARVLAYSLGNQVLLMQQAAERGLSLRLVATYGEWKALGRPVRYGQTGLRIRGFRGEYVVKGTGETCRKFGMTSVFSIDQTIEDGTPEAELASLAHPWIGRGFSADPATAEHADDGIEDYAELTPAQRVRTNLARQLARAGYTVSIGPDDQADPVHIDRTTQTVYVTPSELTPHGLRTLCDLLAELITTADQ